MAINVSERSDGVFCWEIGPEFTIDEIYTALVETRQQMAARPDPAHLLIDASRIKSYPRSNLVPPCQLILKDTRLDLLVYIHSRADTTLIEMVFDLARQHTPSRTIRDIRFVHSRYEAERLLRTTQPRTHHLPHHINDASV